MSATPILTERTVGPSGADHTTVTLWLSWVTSTYGTNLVSQNRIHKANLIGNITDSFSISGYTEGLQHYFHITSDTEGTLRKITQISSNVSTIVGIDDWSIAEWLEVEGSGYGNYTCADGGIVADNDCSVRYCNVHDIYEDSASCMGINTDNGTLVSSCMVWKLTSDSTGSGGVYGIYCPGYPMCYTNNTVYDLDLVGSSSGTVIGIYFNDNASVAVLNNIVGEMKNTGGNGSTACYNQISPGSAECFNNISEDATAPSGTDDLRNIDFTDSDSPGAPPQGNGWIFFEDITSATYDLRLKDPIPGTYPNQAVDNGVGMLSPFGSGSWEGASMWMVPDLCICGNWRTGTSTDCGAHELTSRSQRSVVFAQRVNCANFFDTYIDEANATTNYITSTDLYTEYPDASNEKRCLFRFVGMENHLTGYTIVSAKFGMYFDYSEGASNDYNVDVHRLKRDWNWDEATWNIYSSGNNWQTAGAKGANDIDTTPSDTLNFTDTADEDTFIEWTGMKSLIEDILANDNYGFLMKEQAEVNYARYDSMNDRINDWQYLIVTIEESAVSIAKDHIVGDGVRSGIGIGIG